MKKAEESPYLRRQEAAAYLRMGRTSFDQLRQQGAISDGIPLSQGVRVWTKRELDDFVERQQGKTMEKQAVIERLETVIALSNKNLELLESLTEDLEGQNKENLKTVLHASRVSLFCQCMFREGVMIDSESSEI